MKKQLLLLSFIEGAVVMVAELCGARLLAPVFGSSLYVWATVMGITLAALAGGYFFGGFISGNNGAAHKRLFLLLYAAAMFVMSMPAVAYYLVPRIAYLPFLTGVVTSCFFLLFFPVFFLGATSPLFIALQTQHNAASGRVSGTVYAVSTVGGIGATFVFGFWFIPAFGLSLCLLVSGALLLLTALVIAAGYKAQVLLLALLPLYLGAKAFKPGVETLHVSEGLMGRLEVKEYTQPDGTRLRLLVLNGTIQTQKILNSEVLPMDYSRLLDTLVKPAKQGGGDRALLLGLGGGQAANLLAEKKFEVDAVEFDERIIEAAKQYFFLDKRVNTYCEDARYYLNINQQKYKLLFFDVFKAEEQPGHILTKQSLGKIKRVMRDSALLIVNWHGYLKGETGRGSALLYNTLKDAGFTVKLCSLSKEEDRRNVFFVAAIQPLKPLPFELTELPTNTTEVNTDDKQLMERYNASANRLWRANYLRYYQQ